MDWSDVWLRIWALEPKCLDFSHCPISYWYCVTSANALTSVPQFPHFLICKMVTMMMSTSLGCC